MGASSLFTGVTVSDLIIHQEKCLRHDIDAIDAARLLGTSVDDWCEYFEPKFRLHVPKLLEDQITVDQHETNMTTYGSSVVKGTSFKYFVPFEGDASVFGIRPSQYTLTTPMAEVGDNELVFSYSGSASNTELIKSRFNGDLSQVRNSLETLSKDLAAYNGGIKTNAQCRLIGRREKLIADDKAVNSLGFPLRRREGAPNTFTVPAVRRKASVAPIARSAGSPLEPTLDVQEYEHILSVITNMTQVMERSPHAFREMKEEDLRVHFLVQLNGQYDGQATGETFNSDGKTDILIRSDGRNVFIAECKFWDGAKSLTEALDQLLGYATWRDSKLALIIFNKNKGFSAVVSQVPELLRKHPNFLRETTQNFETGFRAVMHHNDDKQRELIVTVLAFDIPQ